MPNFCIRKKCPHIKEPFEECYCHHMSSQSVEKAVRFCGGNFEECDIYQRHHNHNNEEVQLA